MGREVRRVTTNWQHPKDAAGQYIPLYGHSYRREMSEWIEDHDLWLRGEHPCQLESPERTAQYKFYAEWYSDPPKVASYCPEWEEPTWYQVYETVTAGTPITPPFSTQDELIDYLSSHGTFWDDGEWSRAAAITFVTGSVPVIIGVCTDPPKFKQKL